MSKRSSKRSVASARLRERLGVVRACEKSGESLKAYAERRGLSVHMLYQAKKIARQRGLLPPYRGGKPRPARLTKKRVPRCVEAAVATVHPPAAVWRLRFAGGEVLEGGAPLGVSVAVRLIESLGRRS